MFPRTAGNGTTGPLWFNVKAAPYNAKGDGVTDDTAAIAAANAAAALAAAIAPAKGTTATVYFPPGEYISKKITINTRVIYRGEGPGISVLVLKPGEATNFLEGANFATLTGTNSNGGPTQFQIHDLTVYGNKASCPSALRGIAVYGTEFQISNVFVQNCVTDGMYFEFNGDSSSLLQFQILDECFIRFCKIQSCGGNGLWINGVHDSTVVSVNCGFNGGGIGSGTGGVRAENGGVHFVACHNYGTQQDYAWNLRGQSFLVDCVGEGAQTAQFFCAFNDVNIQGGTAYFPATSASKAVAFNSGATTNRCIINGLYINKGGAGADFANAIDFTHAGTALVLRATVNQATGNAYTGTVPTDATVQILTTGGTTSPNLWQSPGAPAVPVPILTTDQLPPALYDSFTAANNSAPSASNWTLTLGSSTGTAGSVQGNALQLTSGNAGGFSVHDEVNLQSTLANTLADAEMLWASVAVTVNAASFLYAGLRSSGVSPVRATNAYFVQVGITAAGILSILLLKRVASVETTLYNSGNIATVAAGAKYWIRFRVQGTTISVKWWIDGVAEPTAFQFSATDTGVAGGGDSTFTLGGGSPAGNNAAQSIDSAAIFAL